MDKIYIDLETIKCTSKVLINHIEEKTLDNIKPNANCKLIESKEKSILKQKEEFNIDDVIKKTVFDGGYGEIITIGYAINDEPVQVLQRDNYIDEISILTSFFDELKTASERFNVPVELFKPLWIAHNKAFDFRFLYKRCVINNIETHGIRIPVNDRHGTKHAYCTMEAWNGYGAKPGGSLDELCMLLGMDGKGDMDGSMVWDMWENKEYDKIAEYCKDDVSKLRKIYKRQNFIG